MQRRFSTAAIERARRDGDADHAAWLEAQQLEVARAKIRPGDVFGFHVGSLLTFGVFLAGVIFILSANGRLAEEIRWSELRRASEMILLVVAAGFLIDLWGFRAMPPAEVQGRVDACLTRWSLFWLLGFVGTILIGVTGRATVFFGFFAILKITFEGYGRLARALGWRSHAERQRSVYDSPGARG